MFKIFRGGGTSECLRNIQQASTTAIHGRNLQLLGRPCPSRHQPHPRRQTSTRTQGSGSVASRRSSGPTHFLSTQNVLNRQRSPRTATCRRRWATRGWEIMASPLGYHFAHVQKLQLLRDDVFPLETEELRVAHIQY